MAEVICIIPFYYDAGKTHIDLKHKWGNITSYGQGDYKLHVLSNFNSGRKAKITKGF